MKAYILGEVQQVINDSNNISVQIEAMKDVVRMAEAQTLHLNDLNGEKPTQTFIGALREACESLALLQKILSQNTTAN